MGTRNRREYVLEINYYEEILFGVIVGALFMLWAIELIFPEDECRKDHEGRDWSNKDEDD